MKNYIDDRSINHNKSYIICIWNISELSWWLRNGVSIPRGWRFHSRKYVVRKIFIGIYFHILAPGLGRVPDLQVRVQVRVLAICVSTSTSLSTWLLHESESEYWLMSTSTSTSTGIWSTFYIKSSIAFFSLWRGNPQILINLRQSYNFPLSMQIPFVNIYICLTILRNLVQWHFNLRNATNWLSWLTITTCCQFKNRKQKLRNIRKYVENSLFF